MPNSKKFLGVLLASVLFFSGSIFANGNGNDKPFFKNIENTRLNPGPKLFSFDLDVQVGLGIASSSFKLNKVDSNSNVLNNTGTKVGPSVGATVSLNLLGYGFSTGVLYTPKGFQTTSGSNFNLHYFVIPWLLYFNFDISRVRIEGNFGPYVGVLLNKDAYLSNNVNLFAPKNVDVGISANVEGTYFFTKILGALLGVKYEYGGLNNLASTEYINSLHTSTVFVYTGLKISI